MTRQSMIKQNMSIIVIGFFLIGVGFALGWLGFLSFGDIAKNCQVVFVSQEAIVALEENRVQEAINENVTDDASKMFFGKTARALADLEEIAKAYGDKRTKVLFVSNKSGLVKNGLPISAAVHRQLVTMLGTAEGRGE